jgi:hypothetical protein
MKKHIQLIGVRAWWWPRTDLSYDFGLCGIMPVIACTVVGNRFVGISGAN